MNYDLLCTKQWSAYHQVWDAARTWLIRYRTNGSHAHLNDAGTLASAKKTASISMHSHNLFPREAYRSFSLGVLQRSWTQQMDPVPAQVRFGIATGCIRWVFVGTALTNQIALCAIPEPVWFFNRCKFIQTERSPLLLSSRLCGFFSTVVTSTMIPSPSMVG